MADGWITIGTELSTNKFDKQVADLEKKMQKEEDKKIIIETKLEGQKQELETARQKTDELADAYQRLKTAQEQVTSGKATPTQFATMQELQGTYGTLEQIGNSFDKALSKQDAINQKVIQTESKYNELNAKVSEYKSKIENVKMQKQISDVEKLKSAFNNVGSSIQSAVGKVGKLVLGIFAVRSAYAALKSASSNLATYDKQYAANIEYIRYALTQAIAPVLQWIVSLAAKLLGYLNAIMQGWFGINLFSRGSAENFNKMKASTGGISKAVKEIKKQLLGFDEINMLTDQSDTGTNAGSGRVGTPDFDLSAMQGDVPPWLKWIVDHKDLVLSILAGIALGLLALKLGLGGIKALGIGVAIGGIVYALQGLMKYLNDPSWVNFGQTIQGIGVAIIGLGIIIGSVPVAIAGAIVLIVGTIIKYWEQIKAFLQGGIDWLAGKSDWIHEHLGGVVGFIYDIIVGAIQAVLNIFDSLFTAIKGIFDGIINVVKGIFTLNWQQAWEGIKQIFMSVWNFIKGVFESVGGWLYNTVILPVYNFFKGLWEKISDGFKKVWEGIKSVFSQVGTFFKNTFSNAWNAVKNIFSTGGKIFTGIKEGIVNAFKNIVNAIIKGINKVVSIPFNAINSVLNGIRNINILGVQPFTWVGSISVPQIPYLKTGGIINMPNKGTMVGGSALGGESGREGVVPLTDQQAMAELGREIGKNVLVNLTNITTMNGRVISRELKSVQSDQDFAYNT